MNVKLFIENYEMPFMKISVQTGIGPLKAEIVIPPGDKRRQILPGSRVNAFMQCQETQWQWVWWFRGYTTNFAMDAIGMDSSPVVLNVESELSVLNSVNMSYLLMGQEDGRDLKVRENYMAGKMILAKFSPGDIFFKFHNIDDKDVGFGNRIQGLLMTLASLNPAAWEQIRRNRTLDYLLIETADKLSEQLNAAVVFGGITHLLAQIQSPKFSAMDILATVLQYIFHDLVSVAPLRLSTDGWFRSPNTDLYGYMPKGVDWWSMSDTGQGSLARAFCQMETTNCKIFDHVIKPDFERNPVIAGNDIDMDQFQTAYVQEVGRTRTTMRIPFGIFGKPDLVSERQAPQILNNMYDISENIGKIIKDEGEAVAQSNLLANRMSGVRTNEERVINKVYHEAIMADQRLASVIRGLAQNKGLTEEEVIKMEAQYLQQYAEYEHEADRGTDVQVSNAKYNPSIMPGFYTYIHGLTDMYVGKITQKVDVYDFSTSTCSSNYMITRCIKSTAHDFNKTKQNAEFNTLDDTFEPYVRAAHVNPVFEDMNKGSQAAFKGVHDVYVPYAQALVHLGLKEGDNKQILEPELLTQAAWDEKDNIKYAYRKDLVGKEQFYSVLDMLPERIDRQINGYMHGNMFLPDDALLSLYRHTDSIPDSKYAFLLDIKSLSVFTFASLIMGAVIPGDNVLTPSAIREMGRQSIFSLPLWEGNPFPQRVDMLLHYLSRMNKSDWKEFIKNGVVPKTLISATIPRPISDRQLIHLRRAIVEAAYGER